MLTRTVISTLFLAICCFSTAEAQFKIGLRVGTSTTDIDPSNLNIIENGTSQLSLALKEARYGIHGGLVIQAKIGKFLIQPEFLFNSSRVDYEITDPQDPDFPAEIKEEKYQHLDIPLLFGAKFGPLRLHAGPVGHVYINSSSELTDLEGYEQKFDEFTFGWQGGLGLDLWKLMIDLRYEGNFSKFGDHITFFGDEYKFDQSAARFLISIGFMFGK